MSDDTNQEGQVETGATEVQSLDDALAANFDQLANEGAQGAAATEGAQAQAAASGMVRDPATGRFVPKAAAVATTETGAKQPGQQQTQTQTQTQVTTTDTMPASWKGKRETIFNSLPPEAKAAIAEREAEMERGVARFAGLGRYAEMAERNGLTLSKVFDNYAAAEKALATNFVDGVKQLAAEFNFDVKQLAAALAGEGGTQQQQQQTTVPREVLDRIDGIESTLTNAQRQSAAREVQAFAADPANKYFEEVADKVASLIRQSRVSGNSLSLKDAYEQAIWTDPNVRQKVLADQAATQAQNRIATANATATTARRAGKSLNGASVGSQPVKTRQSLDQTLADAYDQLAG